MKKTIFFILGKSCSGKTTILNTILEHNLNYNLNLKRIKLHTNRPQRSPIEDDSEYYFDKTPVEELNHHDLFDAQFYTVKNKDGESELWYYYTSLDEFNNDNLFYIVQGPLVMYNSYVNKFGDTMNIVPIYIKCNEDERVMRYVEREKKKLYPNWSEMYRRLHEDESKFKDIDFLVDKAKNKIIITNYNNTFHNVASYIILQIQAYKIKLYEDLLDIKHKES